MNREKQIKEMKDVGITKVELCCPFDCKCCENIKNKALNINEIELMPFRECEAHICVGRYIAVVEF